jgi:hypothetical protein
LVAHLVRGEPLSPEKCRKNEGDGRSLAENSRLGEEIRREGRDWNRPAISAVWDEKENVMLTRFAQVFNNTETLKIVTSGNCELFAMSG